MTSTQRSPGGRIGRALVRVVLPLLALWSLAVVVFRSQWPPAIDAVRHLNKAVLNPAMLRVAGSEHWYASIVHHVGRSSGKPYSTPVVVQQSGDQLYIPLPYGTRADWCANVRAAGGCTVEHKGRRLEATAPAIVPFAEAAPVLSPRLRRSFAMYGVDSFLRLTVANAEPTDTLKAPPD